MAWSSSMECAWPNLASGLTVFRRTAASKITSRIIVGSEIRKIHCSETHDLRAALQLCRHDSSICLPWGTTVQTCVGHKHVMIPTSRSYTSTTQVLCYLKQAPVRGDVYYCGCADMTYPSVSLGEGLYERA